MSDGPSGVYTAAVMAFEVRCRDKNTAARSSLLAVSHGLARTPSFMPVGTQGSVKAMHPDQLRELGAEIILGNTYHLALRPGHELIRSLGGLHRFMGWERIILTDSGGFQLYSMEGLHRVSEEGVSFASHIDGSRHFMSPEDCVSTQKALGSDIMMVLDHCVPYPSSPGLYKEAMELTCRWAERSRSAHHSGASENSLFGILQGGFDKALREECADRLLGLSFDGYAVGGLSVGEPKELLLETAAICSELLPADKPRYVMGVGPPEDLLALIGMGYDLFDCVLPTRNARTGTLFTSRGKLVIRHARFRDDPEPIDNACKCKVCEKFSRAYLRHLFVSGEILGHMLNTYHNLHFFLTLTAEARRAIEKGDFHNFRREFLHKYRQESEE